MPAQRANRYRRFDPRPASPGHLALVGLALWLIGVFVAGLGVLMPAGLAVLAVAGVSYVLRPRQRISYWRGRPVDLSGGSPHGARLYRLIYRR